MNDPEFIIIPADLTKPVQRHPMAVLESFAPLWPHIGTSEHRGELYVEPVNVFYRGRESWLFVHEEGLMRDMPANPRATALVANRLNTARPYDDVETDPLPFLAVMHGSIVGDCVLFTGEWT